MNIDAIMGISNAIKSLYLDRRELAAIWLDKPLNTPFGRTVRLTQGSLVKIENGKLIDFTGEPSHKVIACFGTLNSQFELILIDLKTNEPVQIKL